MMEKGMLSLQVIVMMILAVLVLIVLGYFYRTQLSNLLESFTSFIPGKLE